MPTPVLRRSLWALAVAVALVVLAVLLLPYAASTRLVRDRIAHELGEWSGLDVAIAAAPEIAVWPDLQANLTGVTLSLPGSKVPAIAAERVEIELSPLAALAGNVDFSRARLIRPTVRIEAGTDIPVLPGQGRIAEAIEAARLANALARLGIGDRVRIGHDVRPGYVHGLPATVVRRGTDTITIQLDRPVGKYVDGCIRCSPLAVEKIGT